MSIDLFNPNFDAQLCDAQFHFDDYYNALIPNQIPQQMEGKNIKLENVKIEPQHIMTNNSVEVQTNQTENLKPPSPTKKRQIETEEKPKKEKKAKKNNNKSGKKKKDSPKRKRVNYCFEIHRSGCSLNKNSKLYCKVFLKGKLQSEVDLIKGARGKWAYTFYDQRKKKKERRYWPSQSSGPVIEDACNCDKCIPNTIVNNISGNNHNEGDFSSPSTEETTLNEYEQQHSSHHHLQNHQNQMQHYQQNDLYQNQVYQQNELYQSDLYQNDAPINIASMLQFQNKTILNPNEYTNEYQVLNHYINKPSNIVDNHSLKSSNDSQFIKSNDYQINSNDYQLKSSDYQLKSSNDYQSLKSSNDHMNKNQFCIKVSNDYQEKVPQYLKSSSDYINQVRSWGELLPTQNNEYQEGYYNVDNNFL